MTRTADVVVVGAGVVGASIAHHLADAGASVVVHEGGEIAGRGATAFSAGQIRLYHSDPADADLAVRSLPTFAHWADVVGGDCGFHRTGFAFLAGPDRAGEVDTVVARLAGSGADIELRDPARFAAEHPGLRLGGVARVAYEPSSGWADPARTVRALLAAAARRGAAVHPGEPVVSLVRSGDAVVGVRTAAGRTDAPLVVLALGSWTGDLLPPGGLPLDTRTYGWCLVDGTGIPGGDRLPMVIDDVLGTYFRPDEPGRLLLRAVMDGAGGAIPSVDTVDDATAVWSRRLAANRVPALATAQQRAVGHAVESSTPDGRPLIGPVPGVPGLYLATGFSGGGFKAAPAVGAAVAAELTGGAAREELARYRPGRFVREHAGGA